MPMTAKARMATIQSQGICFCDINDLLRRFWRGRGAVEFDKIYGLESFGIISLKDSVQLIGDLFFQLFAIDF